MTLKRSGFVLALAGVIASGCSGQGAGTLRRRAGGGRRLFAGEARPARSNGSIRRLTRSSRLAP